MLYVKCKNWSLTLRAVFENMVLKIILGPTSEELTQQTGLYNEELQHTT
jgi:hypothetical protein